MLDESILLLLGAVVFGLIIGSFLNVAIHRFPLMLIREWHSQCREFLTEHPDLEFSAKPFNLFLPGSHCPHCKTPLKPWHNIPLLSYLLLRGRCRQCRAPISLRYPLVELLAALLTVFIVWHFGFSWQMLAALIFTLTLVVLTFIDLDQQLLPDEMTLGLVWLGLFCNLFGLFATLPDAVIGAIAGYSSLWLFANGFKLLTGKDGMGYGDFKLFAAAGAWLGWQVLPFVILTASVVGAVMGIGLIFLRGHQRQQPIPFGPYLAIAMWLGLIWGDQFNHYYLHLFM